MREAAGAGEGDVRRLRTSESHLDGRGRAH